LETLSRACSRRCWPSTPRASTWSIRSRSGWIASSGTLSRCSAKSNRGGRPRITDAQAKLLFYSAFVDGKLEAPRSLLPEVHRLYFEPEYPEFSPRTMWSLSNAFTSACKKLDPVPQFQGDGQAGGISQSIACMIPAVPFPVVTPRAGSAALCCRRIWSSQLPSRSIPRGAPLPPPETSPRMFLSSVWHTLPAASG
jgi:hypothetical protein